MQDVPTETLSAHPCHLGEGSTFDPATGTAFWFDILERTLFCAEIATRTVRMEPLPAMASELAVIDEERDLIATDTGLHVRERKSGAMTLLQGIEEDDSATRSNDGRVHPCGALWIGTMGREAETGAGSIYWFFRGELRKLYSRLTIPNAIAFTQDGRTGYFTDTDIGILHRVALDPATGLPVDGPEMLYDHRGGTGGLDGAVVDAQGLVWNARWGAGCLDAYSPEGTRLRTVRVPATRPTCPVFVGRAFDRLLVTTASEGMSEAERTADPRHGQTFLLDVGACGFAETRARPFALA
ncbi:SMP-30/gluconolactonase/LRE family protein [Aureimonas populi]|uniref:SMP-30/gluconolactonase/LRE family protein n=1 Tax=Aureimonas populi TaxID=1701758 RepID=A0ABW5CQT5_9HYPH|nr:SMP-30/gluconolactonase/LRE family protein [Aureimonas populi]